MNSFKIFRLEDEILSNLMVNSVQEDDKEEIVTATNLFCSTCQFKPSEREHFKCDWHLYNLKRKLNNQVPISELDFEEKQDISSIESSDDENVQVKIGSPFVRFSILDGKYKGKDLLVYKQVLAQNTKFVQDWEKRLLEIQRQNNPKWAFIMMASGHFSGAVLDCITGNQLVHKTFHRYTTRRKQGGAQSAHNNSKGKAKSAGSGIRTYNEQALREEIQQLLVEWKELLDKCDLIFVRSPVQMKRIVYFDESVLKPTDERIRSIPFITKRPTLVEVSRCFEELQSCKLAEPELIIETTQKIKKEVINEKTHFIYEKEAIQPALLSEDLQILMEAIKKGRFEFLKGNLPMDQLDLIISDQFGTSFLHAAASNSQVEILNYLLEIGCDPTIKNEKGFRPYDVASTKDVRDTFRRFMAKYPDKWDYSAANVPGPLTAEMEEHAKEKERIRRKKEKERKKIKPKTSDIVVPSESPSTLSKKITVMKLGAMDKQTLGMSPEEKMKFDREKRALSAEARFRAGKNQCGACEKSLIGIKSFDKSIYRYCSMECLKVSVY